MGATLKVLIVEDDATIAEMTEEVLLENGYAISGVASTVTQAMSLARLQMPDLAVIDLRLAENGLGTEVARRLEAFGRVGVLYTTGDPSADALLGAIGDARLLKPYAFDDLLRALELVKSLVATGTAHPPFPKPFKLLRGLSKASARNTARS